MDTNRALFVVFRTLRRRSFARLVSCNHPLILSSRTSKTKQQRGSLFYSVRWFLIHPRFEFFQRSNHSGLTSPMTSSMHSDIQGLSYAADMRVLMENMQALNVNHRQDDLLTNSSTSLKDRDPRSSSVRQYTPQSYRSQISQSLSAETSEVSLSRRSTEYDLMFDVISLERCRHDGSSGSDRDGIESGEQHNAAERSTAACPPLHHEIS